MYRIDTLNWGILLHGKTRSFRNKLISIFILHFRFNSYFQFSRSIFSFQFQFPVSNIQFWFSDLNSQFWFSNLNFDFQLSIFIYNFNFQFWFLISIFNFLFPISMFISSQSWRLVLPHSGPADHPRSSDLSSQMISWGH